MSSSSSCAKPEFERGDNISGFEVIRKLGSGGFGSVYHVKKDGQEWAMKTEFVTDEEEETLRNEVHMLRLMQWSPAFCRLNTAKRLTTGKDTINMMVMTLCSRPLSRLRRMMPHRHFTKSTAARLSVQFLEAIRDLHNSGILHRDIKASNCGWHAPTRRILLFDLGFSRKYLELHDNKMRHRTARESPGFMGTSKYCSMFAHDEMEQGRRDDLWAWLYSSAEFFLGSLPWSSEDKTILVSKMKKKTGRALFYKCPREIVPIYEHIRQLKFDSRPDYNFMIDGFMKMFARLEIRESDPMDFEQGSAYFDEYFNKKSDSEQEMENTSQADPNDTLDKITSLMESEVTLSSTTGSSSRNPVDRIAAGLNRAFSRLIGS